MLVFEGQDFFGSRYRLPVGPYFGPDFSRRCFIFPGQGQFAAEAAHVALEKFEVLRRRFQAADQLALSQGAIKPSAFIESPEEVPREQVALVRNLAQFTLSVGLFEVLLTRGERPRLITSHSFGEYAAFVAAGILPFDEMFQIVLARERACLETASAGEMIAVSASAEDLRAQADLEPEWFANINSVNQVVLSVPREKTKGVLHSLRQKRRAAKKLDFMCHPFHSPLMEGTREKLRGYLEAHPVSFRPPVTPLLSCVDGRILSAGDFSPARARSLLLDQIVSPVDFVGQLRTAVGAEIRHFTEVSLRPLSGDWIRETLEGSSYKVTVPSAFRFEAVDAVKRPKGGKVHDSKLVGLLNRVISSVTGYSVAEISLSKNFQEDLGIDSIKKAQIILNFLEDQGGGANLKDGIAMNQIRTIEDVLNWFTTAPGGAEESGSAEFSLYERHWEKRPGSFLEREFAHSSAPVLQRLGLQGFRARDLPSSLPSVFLFVDEGVTFDFKNFLTEMRIAYPRLRAALAGGRVGLLVRDGTASEVRAVEGFLRSLAQEVDAGFQLLEVAAGDLPDALLAEEMNQPLLLPLRYEGGERHVLGLRPVGEGSRSEAEKKPVRCVAATGGASGATLEILKSLVRQGVRSVFVNGRRAEAEVQGNLRELRDLGCEVTYFQGDCSRPETLKAFLEMASPEKSLDLFLHGAGSEYSALISDQSDEHLESQLRAKVSVLRWLSDLVPAFGVRKVICFSSTAGEFGNAGQAIYAYANMLMTFLAEDLRRRGLPVSTLAWPAWNQVGMTGVAAIASQLRLTGASLLEKEKAAEIFGRFLERREPSRALCLDRRTRDRQARGEVSLSALRSVFPSLRALRFPLGLSHWTQKDIPGLRDHVIMDQSVVPVSLALATLWHLGFFLQGRPLQIQGLEASSFMPLHRRDSPYLLDCQAQNAGHSVEIRSNQVHMRGRLVEGRFESPLPPPYQERAGFSPIDMFKQSYGRFGPHLHLLENVRMTADDRAFAEVDLGKHPLWSANPSFNRQLVLFEALFHLSGACSEAKTGMTSVPLSFERVAVNDQVAPGSRFRLMAKCRYISTDVLEADLFAYNEKGEAFIAVWGERIRFFGSRSG